MDQLLNCTPHRALAFYPSAGEPVTLTHAGEARAVEKVAHVGVEAFGGVPLHAISYGPVSGLPDPTDGATLVVSMLVTQLCSERHDLAFPADVVRNEDGDMIGFRALGRWGA